MINIHYPVPGFALLVDLARELNVPLVVSVHGSDLLPESGAYSNPGIDRLLAAASDVVVPSQTFLDAVVASYPSIAAKAVCIHNGYDARELQQSTTMAPDIAHAGVTALCIAANTFNKGIDVLLRALHALPPGQLRVRLVGNGPYREALVALAAELHLTDRVDFLGSLERRATFDELRRCDFLVLPSRAESFGLAALEAMACGKAVVASAVGGLREVVEDEVTGLLVPPGNPSALAAALSRLASNQSLRNRLGDAGKARAARFTVERTADAYEELFARRIAGN